MTEASVQVPWRRDPQQLGERFAAWFRHVLPAGAEPEIAGLSTPAGTGMSSETVLVDAAWTDAGGARVDRLVARLAPDPAHHPVFPTYDLDAQGRCLQVVGAHTSVPVPEARWYEPDPQWLGTPFLVMTHIDGVAPADIPPYVFGGWLHDASPADRARLERGAVGVLARLHELTPDRADLSFLDRPELGATPLEAHLGYQRSYYEWARAGVDYPIIERTFAWLDAHRPPEGPTAINWGDARIGNILFRDFEPVGVLDWEMAALGPVEVDVSWMVWMHRFFQDLAEQHGSPGIPGFMARDRVVATYEELSGTRLSALEWFDVLAALRHAVITVRTSMRTVVFGQAEPPDDPDELIGFRHLVERMLAGTYWD